MSRDNQDRPRWWPGTKDAVVSHLRGKNGRNRVPDRSGILPPRDRIDPPKDRPALPAPPKPPGPILVPPVLSLPKGPFDPKDALPWDDHVYPDTPSVEVPESYEVELYRAQEMRKWIDSKLRKPRKALPKKRRKPAPPERQLPSPRVPPERQLPAFLRDDDSMGAVWDAAGMTPNDFFQNAGALGLFGPTPLEEYDKYLKSAGIRFFSAHEITRHNWRHARGRVAPGRSSAWHFMYDLFEPEFAPKGFHFMLARHVVPPPELWPNIIPVLRILDRFRFWLGKPVTGYSGYRHSWYNAQIDGSSTSFHMQNGALDFGFGDRFEGYLDYDLFLHWFERLYRQKGDGTGRYASNFIHVDTGWDRHHIPGKTEHWVRPKGWKPPTRR